jgi:hypothetical protein
VEPYDFNLVTKTALIPAFARGQFTDIPWAKEMLTFLRSKDLNLDSGRGTTEPFTISPHSSKPASRP